MEPLRIAAPVPPTAEGAVKLAVTGPAEDGYVEINAQAPAALTSPVTYTWQLGDGTTLSGQRVAFRCLPGARSVTVRAEDAEGRSLTAFRELRMPVRDSLESIGIVMSRSATGRWRPNMVAGVIPQPYWNSLGNKSFIGSILRDNRGRELKTTVSGGAQTPYAPAADVQGSTLEEKWISSAGWLEKKPRIEIKNIPYEQYDMIVVCPGGAKKKSANDIVVTVGEEAKTFRTANQPHDYRGRFIEETEEHPEGNYCVFRNLSGPDQTVQVGLANTRGAPTPGGYVCAIQIVREK